MEGDVFEYIRHVWAIRKKRIILLGLLAIIPVFLIVRLISVPYPASIKIFVNSSDSSSSLMSIGAVGMSSLGGSLATLEKDSLILSQQALLSSVQLYKQVKGVIDEGATAKFPNTWIEDLKESLRSTLKSGKAALFGDNYVANQEKYFDQDYLEFQDSLKFSPDLETGTFSIVYTHDVPDVALKVVHALATGLIKTNIDVAQDTFRTLKDFLAKKVEEQQSVVESERNKIASYIASSPMPLNQSAVAESYSKWLVLQQNVNSARLELMENESVSKKLNELKNIYLAKSRNMAGSADDIKAEAILREIATMESSLLTTKPENSGAISSELRRRVDELVTMYRSQSNSRAEVLPTSAILQILQNIETELNKSYALREGIVEKIREANALESRVANDIKKYPKLEAELTSRRFVVQQNEKVLESLLQQYLSAQIASDIHVSKLTIIEDPMIVPSLLAGKPRLLVLGAIGAMILMLLLVTMVDFARGIILAREQLDLIEGFDCIGAFPEYIRSKMTMDPYQFFVSNQDITKSTHELLARSKVKSGEGTVIVVSSRSPAAGKSCSSMGMAFNVQASGRSVAMIDCDMRATARSLATYYKDFTGLTPFSVDDLMDRAKLAQAIKTPVALFKISATKETFKSAVAPAIESVKSCFDVVIVDGPPAMFSDSNVLAGFADSVVYCVPEGDTSSKATVRDLQAFKRHIKSDGKVFTMLTRVKSNSNFDAGRHNAEDYYYRKAG